MSADIFRDIPDLTAIRNAVVRSPDVALKDLAPMVSLVNVLDGNPDGVFTVTLKSGAVIQVDLTIVAPRPELEIPEDGQ